MLDYRINPKHLEQVVDCVIAGMNNTDIANAVPVSTKTVGSIREEVNTLVVAYHDEKAGKVVEYPEEILFIAKLKRKKRRKDSKNQVRQIVLPAYCHALFMNGGNIYALKEPFHDLDSIREGWMKNGFSCYFLKYFDHSFTRGESEAVKGKYQGLNQDLGFGRMYAAVYKSNKTDYKDPGFSSKEFYDSKLFQFVNFIKEPLGKRYGMNDEQLEMALKEYAVRFNHADVYEEVVHQMVSHAQQTATQKAEDEMNATWAKYREEIKGK